MSYQTIVAAFDNAEQAQATVEALKGRRLSRRRH
jgi:hypothetical protein